MSDTGCSGRYRPSAVTGETELHSGEWEALCSRVAALEVEGRIIEVGTAAGGTLVKLLQALPADKHEQVSVVDTFEYFPDHLKIWQDNLRQNGWDPDVIELLKGTSMEGYGKVAGRGDRLAFVLVDAGHKLKDVIRDVQWLSLLEMGGVGAFHDYSERFPGVMLAVDTFLERHPEFEREALVGTLMFVRKTRETHRVAMPVWLIGWMTFRSLLMQWAKSVRKRWPGARGKV